MYCTHSAPSSGNESSPARSSMRSGTNQGLGWGIRERWEWGAGRGWRWWWEDERRGQRSKRVLNGKGKYLRCAEAERKSYSINSTQCRPIFLFYRSVCVCVCACARVRACLRAEQRERDISGDKGEVEMRQAIEI